LGSEIVQHCQPKGLSDNRRLLGLLSVTCFVVGFVVLTILILPPTIRWLGAAAMLSLVSVTAVTLKAPEITFALFLFAGQFKASPAFVDISNLFDITMFLAIITILVLLIKVLSENRHTKIEKNIVLVWVAFCFLMVLGLLYTPSIGYGWTKTTQFIVFSSLAFIFPLIFFVDDIAIVKRFFYSILVFGVIYSIMAINIGIDKSSDLDFVYITGSNYLGLARIAGMGIIVALLYLIPRRGVYTLVGIAAIVLSGGALLLSGGRGPLLALASTLPFVALASLIFPNRLDRTVAVPSIVIALLFIGLVQFDFLPANLSFRLSLLRPDTLQQDTFGSAYERLRLWQSAWDAINTHPVLGLGSGGFADWYCKTDMRCFPHNPFMEAGAEMGLPGIFFVAYLLWYPLRVLFMKARRATMNLQESKEIRLLSTAALGLLIFIWFSAMVSGELDNRVAWMTVALLVSLSR
jgi:O-antigen ligase